MRKERYVESERLSIILFLFLFLLYAVVYMTKNIFSSAMATIVEQVVMTKSQTGLINAVFWLVYAVFQFAGGFAVDRFSPYKLVMIGLVGALISNVVIYFNQSYTVILIAWTFNAVIQFGVWSGVFKIISTYTSPTMRKKAVFWILFSTSLGLGLSMLVASFVKQWQDNFIVSVVSLLIIIVLYPILNYYIEKRMVTVEGTDDVSSDKQKSDKSPMMPLVFSSGLVIFLILCFLRVMVDNGIKMMTPVMLMESYETLPAAIATRISIILIVFSIFGVFLSGLVQRKITTCEAKAQIILYLCSLVPLGLTCFVGHIHYIYILISLSLAILFVHATSSFSQSFVAVRFEKYGRIGTVSGILNATASIGNVFASYVFARMSETMSWNIISIFWLGTSILCIILCAIVLPRWTKFINK